MKIKFAHVAVRIGAPYFKTLEKSFSVKEGNSYIKEGYLWAHYLVVKFVEENIKNSSSKDVERVLENSTIQVKRFK